MAEQWIPARKALEIAGGAIALCTRCHAGLVAARADCFLVDGEERDAPALPKGFWWAKGHAALDQDWNSGDFGTWIDNKHHLQAFGVSFALSGLLEFVEFEKRAELALDLSVAGNPDWISARESLRSVYLWTGAQNGRRLLIEQAELGFVSACAVAATATTGGRDSATVIDEREWNIPVWFWTEFTRPNESTQDWDLGQFSGRGRSPYGRAGITLKDVHFLRSSIVRRFGGGEASKAENEPSTRGRKARYDWAAATNAVWGELTRGDFKPKVQADIEQALIAFLSSGDDGPNESSARPYAKAIWEEYQKP